MRSKKKKTCHVARSSYWLLSSIHHCDHYFFLAGTSSVWLLLQIILLFLTPESSYEVLCINPNGKLFLNLIFKVLLAVNSREILFCLLWVNLIRNGLRKWFNFKKTSDKPNNTMPNQNDLCMYCLILPWNKCKHSNLFT